MAAAQAAAGNSAAKAELLRLFGAIKTANADKAAMAAAAKIAAVDPRAANRAAADTAATRFADDAATVKKG